MNLLEVVQQVRRHLEESGRVSYRMLRRQFELDDDALEGALGSPVDRADRTSAGRGVANPGRRLVFEQELAGADSVSRGDVHRRLHSRIVVGDDRDPRGRGSRVDSLFRRSADRNLGRIDRPR